jgi:putative phosphoribosyl transferase
MAPAPLRFADRREAGQLLADALDLDPGADAIVYGIPRGGVVVAAAVADALGAPLDTLVVRKLGHPGQEEAAFGAVGEDGVVMPERLANIGSEHRLARVIEPAVERLREEVGERVREYRRGRPRTNARGRTAVVVDDGLATGYTFAAALEVVARDEPRRLIGAVPVAAEQGLAVAAEHCDEMRALMTVSAGSFFAVSLYYDRFGQVGDTEVQSLLQTARRD